MKTKYLGSKRGIIFRQGVSFYSNFPNAGFYLCGWSDPSSVKPDDEASEFMISRSGQIKGG